jgi:DNA (cytosine-5)-methyltransferase 1
MGTGGNQVPVVHSDCIAGNTIDRQPQNGGNGNGNQEELSYTLNTVDRHAVAYSMGHDERSEQFTPNKTDPLTASDYKQPPIVGALCARDYKGVGNQFVDEGKIVVGSLCAHDGRGFNGQDVEQNKIVYPAGKVRRLTPTECERLMGLPDGYTDIDFNGKPAPDSKRYKAIGNGMAVPCSDFIMRRIAEVSNGQNKGHD